MIYFSLVELDFSGLNSEPTGWTVIIHLFVQIQGV